MRVTSQNKITMETLVQMTDLFNISTQLMEMYPNASTKDIIKVACEIYEDEFGGNGDITEGTLQLLLKNLK